MLQPRGDRSGSLRLVLFLLKHFLRLMRSCLPHVSSGVSVLYPSGVFSASPPSSPMQCRTVGFSGCEACLPLNCGLPPFHPAHSDAPGEKSHLQRPAIAQGLLHCTGFTLYSLFAHPALGMREKGSLMEMWTYTPPGQARRHTWN